MLIEHRTLTDQTNEQAEPVPTTVRSDDFGVEVTIKGKKYDRASVFVEYYDGEVHVHVWDEEAMENDPSHTIKLVEEPHE